MIATAFWPLAEGLAQQPSSYPAAPRPLAEIVVARQSTFSIPFRIPPSTDPEWQPVEAQLYVSVDRGEHWRLYAKVPIARGRFAVRTSGDGEYWFAIRTSDRYGHLRPRTITGPGLRVVVDTKSRGGNPAQPGQNQQQLAARQTPPQANPTRTSSSNAPEPSETPAPGPGKNSVAVNISPAVGAKYLPPSGPTDDGPALPGMPAGERPRMVRDHVFNLDYNTHTAGPAGIGKVELFGTRDAGKTWRSYGIDMKRQSPMQVRINQEGLYGFRVVVTSRTGYGPRPPRSGDQPDQWVFVDWTPPVAKILSTQRGVGPEADEVTVAWQAEDKMLSARPITISYSQNAGGPWITIASGLENSGRYVWTPDDRVPASVYLRLEARDEAGNIGTYDSPDAIRIASSSTASTSSTSVRSTLLQPAQSYGNPPAAAVQPSPDAAPQNGPSLGQP